MASLLQILFCIACITSFSYCSAEISRKELRSKETNQANHVQSDRLTQLCRSDPSRVVQLSWEPRVFVYKGFISEEDCDHLISLAHGQGVGTNSVVSNTRGSRARSLAALDDEVVARIEEKISAWALLPLENSKSLQVLHYRDEDAKQKYDYFGNKSDWQVNEPLMATVVLFLSDVSQGGEISFPESQLKTSQLKTKLWPSSSSNNNLLRPIKGNAILFFNVHPNASPDKSSYHERDPIIEGEMWCATKFFHIRSISKKNNPSEQENSDCTDEDENCPQWAALGECQKNPVFMVGSPDYYGTCRKSCHVC
ncbi:putative prolyl 4-hydroxylase 12 [Bienertia sinuspersici]